MKLQLPLLLAILPLLAAAQYGGDLYARDAFPEAYAEAYAEAYPAAYADAYSDVHEQLQARAASELRRRGSYACRTHGGIINPKTKEHQTNPCDSKTHKCKKCKEECNYVSS